MDVVKTVDNLKSNGFSVVEAQTAAEAKQKVIDMVPVGAEVMTLQSMTVNVLGLPEIFNDSGKYNSVKARLKTMNRATQSLEMQKLGTAPEWAVGSVHAITEAGQVVIASNTGSQLPADAYGATHLVWIVGQQKIVPDLDAAFKRVYDYILPKESARLQQVYGKPELQSNVSKILIINKEINPNRITLILVHEELGF